MERINRCRTEETPHRIDSHWETIGLAFVSDQPDGDAQILQKGGETAPSHFDRFCLYVSCCSSFLRMAAPPLCYFHIVSWSVKTICGFNSSATLGSLSR